MGGSIRFESDPTVKPGTTCVILLPLKPCEEAPSSLSFEWEEEGEGTISTAGEESERNELNSPTKTPLVEAMIQEPLSILITNDIKMNRIMLRHRLQKCIAPNCIIQEAATGEEALQLCAANTTTSHDKKSFDVVIMDQYMEEAGGLLVGTDVIISMRRSKIQSLIIGCSGNDLDESFQSAGADIVWKKPIPSNVEIIRQLRQHLGLQPEDV
jgi:CheY-like chemotaxis protein